MRKIKRKTMLWRNNKSFFCAFMALTLTMSSCSSDDGNDQNIEITEETAANAIIMAASPEAGGVLAYTMEGISILEGNATAGKAEAPAKSAAYECGVTYDEAFTHNEVSEDISVSMNYTWTWMLHCDEMHMPLSAELGLNGQANIKAPNLDAATSMEADMTISGLEENSDSYSIDANHTVEGAYEFTAEENTYKFTSVISFSSQELIVLKENHGITSGTTTITFAGAGNGGKYSFSGTLEYHGDQTATLTMKSGNKYPLSW
ncbi:hypothetical protein MQE36_05430 [Zhouia spongiae]|uniref:Lipocalin-like domain-containing protein n=1 Tax=Zhouia spongiae TaxID=2202721 RepID=A0ABY3YQL7_9FLAO|nr:hypothetical protein [Zhouia spongiae]UNY99786.1 hypothetical protein MQE36_05430 [Zhouia spongiae]